jgi:Mg-chelatase subunit ChlD
MSKKMKTYLSLFATALVAALPLVAETTKTAKPVAKPRIEVCFVLDTTGSMGGLIEGAKQKIWSIANEVVAAKPTPTVKFALIGYRDRGDEYVTRITPLTDDMDAVYADLRKFRADGGGDAPESVSQALDEAVRKIEWSQDRSVLKIIYLVGDAPPHTDYADGPDYKQVCVEAAKRDLIINTIQCGDMAETKTVWTEIARKAEGQYVALAQTGNMIAVSTPYDKPLADLNVAIGRTIVAYGAPATRAAVQAKQEVVELAPFAVAADRLAFNATSGGKVVQGSGELIDALKAGSIQLKDVKSDMLPAEWQKLNESDLKERIDATKEKRAALQKEAETLNRQRAEFIAAEQKRLVAAGRGDSFDTKVADILRDEAKKKGIEYGAR